MRSAGPVLSGVTALLLAVACEHAPVNDFKPVLNVQSIISPDWRASDNLVMVDRTYRIDEQPESIVRGADVLIWRRHGQAVDTTHLQEQYRYFAGDGKWVYGPVAPWYGFSPHDTAYLFVAKDGFDTVRGRTVVPGTFSIVLPESGDVVTAEDTLVWRLSNGAAAYYMSYQTYIQNQWYDFSVLIPNDSSSRLLDSVYGRMPMFFLLNWSPNNNFVVNVTALDTNYSEWVRGPQQGELPAAGISGGIGVFGSGIVREVPVVTGYPPLPARPQRTAPVPAKVDWLRALRARAPAGVIVLDEPVPEIEALIRRDAGR